VSHPFRDNPLPRTRTQQLPGTQFEVGNRGRQSDCKAFTLT
jgi:hypothetical protein